MTLSDGIRKLLGLSPQATEAEALTAIERLQDKKEPAPPPVPVVVTNTIEKELAETKARLAVVEAIHAGKLTPAQESDALKLATTDLSAFRAFILASPVRVPLGAEPPRAESVVPAGLSEVDAQVMEMAGISEKEFREGRAYAVRQRGVKDEE